MTDNYYATDYLIRWLLNDKTYFGAAAASADTCSIDEEYGPFEDYVLDIILTSPKSEEARDVGRDLSIAELAAIDWQAVAEELIYKMEQGVQL